ncbi:MAG: hypothetical protein GEU97_00450 [Actinophytocola sp.]|nr:hypothetical protein [Actinophytocola sp.]
MFTFRDAEYPADPYPGRRAPTSFVHVDGVGYPLTAEPSGYVVSGANGSGPDGSGPDGSGGSRDVDGRGGVPLDAWLAARGAQPLAGRTPVLAYGSNACPSKLTWLRDNLGFTGPAVALLADCVGYAAVWTTGVRARDNQRTVTLTLMPNVQGVSDTPAVTEQHVVLLATDDQLKTLDKCEGADLSCWGEPGRADPRYRRELLPDGVVSVAGAALTAPVQAYVGCHPDRLPALVDGVPVRAVEGAFPASDATNDAFTAPNAVKASFSASGDTPPHPP